MRTQVAIVGAGPAGLLLSQLLHRAGIESVVVERRSRAHVEGRIRAGVLEQGTVEALRAAGAGDRLDREAQFHAGLSLSAGNAGFRVDLAGLAGRPVTVYGQAEVQKDLFAAREAAGGVVLDEAADVALHDVDTVRPAITFTRRGVPDRIDADFVAGCDGAHGACRTAFPPGAQRTYERLYPFGWLGILSRTPPVDHELIYCRHERGFALASMRNPMLSRYYVQCPEGDTVDDWPDERVWAELRARLPADAAERLVTGPSIEKSITPLRSFVAEPLRHGRLFLAGDAGHVVPPTGAKGLNLAVSDVVYLSRALVEHYTEHSDAGLDAYSATALRRVWKAVRFSWWMTTLLHTFPADDGGFAHRIAEAELDLLATNEPARAAMAAQYVGLPL